MLDNSQSISKEELHSFFKKNYNLLKSYVLNKKEKIFIGNKSEFKCRYCGKSKPETSFKNKAHSFPEFIGNKSLFSYDECDICNHFFSLHLEDHFANYLGFSRTICQIPGKNKVPSFKTKDKKSRIDVNKHNVEINSSIQNEIFFLNEENNTIKLEGDREPYIPAAVYKCLVKMAISIMPNNELQYFTETIKWILEKDHSKYLIKPLLIIKKFIPGLNPFTNISTFLLKRQDDKLNTPYMYFIVAFFNFFFQIIIPTLKDNSLSNKKFQLTPFPIPFDKNYKYGAPQHWILDFTSHLQRKNEKHEINLSYDSITSNE